MTEQQEEKKMLRIRMVWRIGGAEGRGLPFSPEKRYTLEEWCHHYNQQYGAGTHWIEEFEA